MKDSSNGPLGSQNTDVVYLIARVFNLDKDLVGMRMYVDPQVTKENELLFTSETWSVTPGPGESNP